MKVILSVDSVKYPLTGIGRYTYELTKQLQSQSDLNLLLFAKGRFVPSTLAQEEIATNMLGGLRTQILKSNTVRNTYQLLTGIKSLLTLKSHDDFVFHGPGFYLPKFDGPSVATFHDISIFTWAHCHPPERVRFMQKEMLISLQRASLLITSSEYTRQEISKYFNFPLDKIRTIPLACSSDFYPRQALQTNLVLNKFGLTHDCYTLYVGTIEPRKNIETLLDAYAMLPDATRSRWPLVLTGHKGWLSKGLHLRIEKAVRAGWAYYLGYVANKDLPILFAGSRLFVFPSHYEGFGLPVLEAMSSGVPVVCSNSSSLPEVAGGATLMFDAVNIEELAQLIKLGLTDESWRATAKLAGLKQASTFSWGKCAQETISVYRELSIRNQS
jgi:glycosyltransferase involved in cell wall biosynthesis